MKKYRPILSLVMLIISESLLGQQQYPNLYDVEVNAAVIPSRNTPFYYFTYAIKNGVRSRGNISKFEIDISRKPETLEIDTVGLQFENDGFIEGSFRRHFPFLRGKITPVGLFASPGDSYGSTWTGGFSNNLTAGWGADSALIEHGQRLGGFEMMSKGLPGIRRCIVSPFFDVIALFPDPADTTITYYVPPIDSVRDAAKFYGWTIGPSAPPLNFVATVWLDTLTSYKHQAVALGWIVDRRGDKRDNDEENNDGIVAKLDKRLHKARAALIKGDSSKAREELHEFVKKVEELYEETQEHEKEGKNDKVSFTGEAYALLKHNAEYLIDRLPKEKGGKDRGDK